MSIIFLPIKPMYAKRIMAGSKTYEYRKSLPAKKVTHIVIYASSPQKMIVGIAEVEDILSGPVREIWEKTSKFSGINKKMYFEYFLKKETAFAFKLTRVKKLKKSVSPFDFWKDFRIPQSFRYLEKKSYFQIDSLGHECVSLAS